MPAYFERLDHARFRATSAVRGAWNTEEQHIAPALGLIAHALERDNAARRAEPFELARISFDILGVLPIDVVEVTTRVIRPGRTVELVEATLSHDGRPAVIARAWFLRATDTRAIAGSDLAPMPRPDALEPWSAAQIWPGEFVTTVEVRRRESEPGRAQFWMRPRLALLEHEPIGPTARMLGIIDVANGTTPRVSPDEFVFPNLDLTAHLIRAPRSEWIGLDTTVSFGPRGTGLTHTVLHDEHGPIGTAQQTLTIRPNESAAGRDESP